MSAGTVGVAAAGTPFRVWLAGETPPPDVLGVWETAAGGDSFAASAADEPAVLWQIALPASYAAASAELARRERRMTDAATALDDVDRRLLAFAERWRSGDQAFALPPAGLPQAEQELAAMLLGQPTAPDEAFSARDLIEEAKRLVEEAREFIANAADSIRFAADVETVQDGVALARTRVRWHGDAENLGLPGVSPEQAALHCRAVALALETRIGWLRTAGRYAGGLLTIGAGIATGNPLLVAGGVWRFVKTVLTEWREK